MLSHMWLTLDTELWKKKKKVNAPWATVILGLWPWGPICVPIKFSMVSQHVPKHVLNSTSLYPISFALNSTLVPHVTSSKWEDYNISIMGPCKGWFFNFFLVMSQSMVPITKEKEKEKEFPMAYHLGWRFPNLQKALDKSQVLLPMRGFFFSK